MGARRVRLLLLAEMASWVFGLGGLMCWGGFHVGVAATARHDVERFTALRVAAPARVSASRQAADDPAQAPLAVLRIPKIRLEVPVLRGTEDRTLARAVGHIDGTAQPGTDGNIGIAGHRDGFFRGLKDITPGDVIQLDTIAGVDVYRVERTWVVSPEDVWVLDPTPTRALTLVTCYPFYFIGSAPSRFIVRAVYVGDQTLRGLSSSHVSQTVK